MKKTLLLLTLISFSSSITAQVKVNQNAANSAINTSSAFMDASSSPLWNGTTNQGKGMLYPRVDLVNYTTMSHAGPFNASNNPNYFDGLLVFNTATGIAGIGADSVFPGYYYYRNTTTTANGGHWVSLRGINGATGATGFLSSGTAAGNTPYWNGTNWILNGTNFYNNGSNIGVGTTTPNASAKLEVNSTVQGFLPPRMTTTQRDAILSPAAGLTIYNTTVNCLQWWNGTSWYDGCGNNIPAAVLSTLNCVGATTTGTLTSGTTASGASTSVPYTGGNGGTYAAQAVSSTGVLGLTANLSAGTLAVGAGNLVYTITGTPTSNGTASFAITVGGQSCTFTINVGVSGFAFGSGTGTTNWPTENWGGANRCNRSATIYPKVVLNQPGGFPLLGSQLITTLKWQASVAGLSDGNIKIYMENTAATTTTTSQDWSTTIINTATLVYSGPISFNKVVGSWYGVTLTSPFTWNNVDNLRISVEYTSGANFNNRSWYRTTGAGNTAESVSFSSTCPSPLANGSNSWYPNVLFNN